MSKADYLKSPNQDFSKSISEANVHPIGHNIVFQKEKTEVSFRSNVDHFTQDISSSSPNNQWTGVLYVNNVWWDHSVEVTTRYEMLGGGGLSTSLVGANAVIRTNKLDQNYPGGYREYSLSGGSGSGEIYAYSINIPNGEDLTHWWTNHRCIDKKGYSHFQSMNH